MMGNRGVFPKCNNRLERNIRIFVFYELLKFTRNLDFGDTRFYLFESIFDNNMWST